MKNRADFEQELKELVSLKEQLSQENLVVQEEKTKNPITNPSGPAIIGIKGESGDSLARLKKKPKELFSLYLTNQFVARAINIRADTLISGGYSVVGKDPIGVKLCTELIENSGGSTLFWQTSVNCYIAGDAFLEKIYNLSLNKILKLKPIHPVTFGFKKDEFDKIIVGSDKEPVGYEQITNDENGMEVKIDVPKDRISHLKFNCLGDEFTGLSYIQPGYNTILRLMNMEYSAAQAAIHTANPLMVITCNTKSPHQVAMWGKVIGKITNQDQIFLPEGMEIKTISPGNQNFTDYSDYFLNAVSAAFGVPKGVLLGDSGGGNRAEAVVLSRYFYSSIRSDQRYMQDFFNKIFKEYAEISSEKFEPPQMVFEDVAEDASLMARSAVDLFQAGIINVEEARVMIGYDTDPNDLKKPIQGVSEDIKKETRNAQFPAEKGKVAGDQAGNKKKMKTDPNSLVPPL